LKLRFYLVRHGESVANQWGVVAGQQDVPLTDEGISQACALGRFGGYWRELVVWRVVSSDLQRARNTITHMLQSAGRQDLLERLQFDERLRERSYGAREGMARHIPEAEALKVWQSRGIEPPIYETDENLWQRSSEWMIGLLLEIQSVRKGELREGGTVINVLVSSHAGIIREVLKHLFSLDELKSRGAKFDASRKNRLVIPNSSLSVIEFEIVDGRDSKVILQTARLLQLTTTHHLESVDIHDD
jgi:broad specificity phosphatase PhoE